MALSLLLVSITVLYFSPTACIPIDNGLVLKQRLVSAGPPTKVCNSVADVMFIVDGSTSIGEDNFEIVRIFLRGAVETLTAQAASTWYSTVQFSGIARTEFSFKTFGDDSEKVKDYFSKMPYLRGTTTIGKAIDYAIAKEMTAASGNREGIEDIVIVITDGRSSDDPKPPADRLRALGAQTFAIGITNAVDKDQLVAIAGSNDSVIFVTDFTKLDNTAKETLLSKRKCVTVTEQPILSGEPQLDITCGATSIKIGAETRNPFEGNVYAKNHFADPECRLKANGTQKYAEIEIPHGKCGTTRRRSLNPNGLFIEQTVVFSFHPSVLTKVDRAFKVRCFYMEAAKTVDQEIAVSVLSTGLATNQFVMPVCQYSVHSESPTGPPVRFALVGMPVYHVWECDNTQSGDLFKMRVYNCYVDDGNDSRVQLLDEAGCQVDKFLLRSLEYDQSGMRATQEAHVFKFADRAQLFFQCQIELCVDIEGGCQNTPPQCGEQTTSNSTSGGETATTDETSQSTIASGSAASTTEAASVIDSAPAETTTNSVEPAEAAENASLPTIRKKRFYENELTMPADNIVYQTDVFTDFLEVAGQEDVSLTGDANTALPQSLVAGIPPTFVCMTHLGLILYIGVCFVSFLLAAITTFFAIRPPVVKFFA